MRRMDAVDGAVRREESSAPPWRSLDTDTVSRTSLFWLYRLFLMARSGSSENRPRDPPPCRGQKCLSDDRFVKGNH